MSAFSQKKSLQLLLAVCYSKICLKRSLKKKTKMCFSDRLLLIAGQKYCRMLQWEHSAILSTFMKLPFVIRIFALSILRGRLRQGLLYFHDASLPFDQDVDVEFGTGIALL